MTQRPSTAPPAPEPGRYRSTLGAAVALAVVGVLVFALRSPAPSEDALRPVSQSVPATEGTDVAPQANTRTFTLEALEAAVPPRPATVVAKHPPSGPDKPIVVLISTGHINEDPSKISGMVDVPYTEGARRGLGQVAAETFVVATALIDHGVRVVAGEGMWERLGYEDVFFGGVAAPGMRTITAAPPEERRQMAYTVLRRGEAVDISIILYAIYGASIVVQGIEPREVVNEMHAVSDAVTQLDIDTKSPAFIALRKKVREGRPSLEELSAYTERHVGGRGLLRHFERFVIDERDAMMTDALIRLAKDEKTDTVLYPVGAFHTPGIASRLKAQGVGYLIVEPRGFGGAAPTVGPWRKAIASRIPAPF